MVRGKTIFKCTDCGNHFEDLDIEYCATAFSQPMRCPKCGSWRTRPSGLRGWLNQSVYRSIWENMEELRRENMACPEDKQ